MGLFSRIYLKEAVGRYDKLVGMPYYSFNDFKGLKQEKYIFTNSRGVEIHYFYYFYENSQEKPLILFCPGIGPGHTAYLKEIEYFARNGYKVLTLDYTGCGESKGEILGSFNMPTLDVLDLLNFLHFEKPMVLYGHSLGAYTALNVISQRKDISKAVVMSGFLSIELLFQERIHFKPFVSGIMKYEQKTVPEYYPINLVEYLRNTKDKIYFIHSTDDPVVPYGVGLGIIETLNNPSIKTLRVENKMHNPNYTVNAVNYLHDKISLFNKLTKNKSIKTDEDKINFFKEVSLEKLTEQDYLILDSIVSFIEQ